MTTKLTIPPTPEHPAYWTEELGYVVTESCATALEFWGHCAWLTAQREAALADELAEALEIASDTIRSFDGLIGYGPDCDEKIARFEELITKHKEARQ